MSLHEIEAAADALPLKQQRELLAHLQAKLTATSCDPVDRETWLRELDELRARVRPGGQSIGQILDEIRADRF